MNLPTISENDGNIYANIRETIVNAHKKVHTAVNFAMVEAYWEIGRQIAEEQGERAEYGKQLLQYLSQRLTKEFGKGYAVRNLQFMRQFYWLFPIANTLCSQLSWSHYRLLIRIENDKRREFYLKECAECNWSVRQLERQINSFFYERLLATPDQSKEIVKNEIQTLEPKIEAENILRDPLVLEFLNLKENKVYLESELEQALIDNLQDFILELGKGFAFVARQKRITIDGDHYYIDLVFYNYILKCFVIIDLKAGKLNYQDIGQIDFYVRYYEENVKQKNDSPTIGIILCADKNDTMVKYSMLSDKENLFASQYKLYIPSEEEFRKEIERKQNLLELQKEI